MIRQIGAAGQGRSSILEIRDLTVTVSGHAGPKPVVSNLSFDLFSGEILCIAGESGSGKSMTALAIMGLLPSKVARVEGGSIQLRKRAGSSSGSDESHGTELTSITERQLLSIRGDRIAMVFQEPMTSLNPVLSIGRQIREAIQAHRKISSKAAQQKAVEALKAVRIPEAESRLSQYPHELSGGMRQRVMIAMALALEPDVLIADEPTTALDVTVQGEILELLRELQQRYGTAIILITHDMGVVAEMADRVIVMREGQMVEQGGVREVFLDPTNAYTAQLLNAVPRLGGGAGRLETRQAISPGMDDVDTSRFPAVSVENLKVRFGLREGILNRVSRQVHAVEGVTFHINSGETFALVGESGCGKSTIARAIAGLVDYKGDILVGGRNMAGLDRRSAKELRRHVQMIFQDPFASLDPRMRVGDLIAEPMIIHKIADRQERTRRVEELLERVGLSPDQMSLYPHEFSGGQRQRICIARALALRPKLIIADESVSALDVSVQARVLQLLRELQTEFDLSYLFISHDMAVVENISDRVAVMYLGQIVEIGTRDAIFSNPAHPYTRRLIDAVPIADPRRRRSAFPRAEEEPQSPIRKVGDEPDPVTLREIAKGHYAAMA